MRAMAYCLIATGLGTVLAAVAPAPPALLNHRRIRQRAAGEAIFRVGVPTGPGWHSSDGCLEREPREPAVHLQMAGGVLIVVGSVLARRRPALPVTAPTLGRKAARR
jgi:hypothetical protein